MSELFDIEKITVAAKKLTARVVVRPGCPLRTSEDIEATARVYYLAPAIATHACLGDAGRQFQDCMGDTEIAHLLEHLTVEIMRETGLDGKVSSGRTRAVAGEERAFDVELSCSDDALTIGALSSASFMMDWAFLHADSQAPDFPGTVEALASLVGKLRDGGVTDEELGLNDDERASETGARESDADLPPVPAPVIDTEGASVSAHAPADGAVFGGAASEPSRA